jgi:hypothetical protein
MSMEKSQRRQTKVKIVTPRLDVEEFNALTDLLFELLKENSAACARALGISRITWKRWEKSPPDWPYWNIVLRHVIKAHLVPLAARRGLTVKHRQRIIDSLARVSDGEKFGEEMGNEAYNVAGAQAHLRNLLARKGRYWHDIRAAANCGGYTGKQLRTAAKLLGVVKTQEGYGEDKRSYWRLPDQDDD